MVLLLIKSRRPYTSNRFLTLNPVPFFIMGKYQNLTVWKKSKDLAVYIYKITSKGAFSKDFGLRDQIRRAVVSIPSNIAEGDELSTNKQAINFFYIAKGSCAEVLTQAIISFEIGYINQKNFEYIENECIAISSMLARLIQFRSKSKSKPKPTSPKP
jgi:four helix bundle protein